MPLNRRALSSRALQGAQCNAKAINKLFWCFLEEALGLSTRRHLCLDTNYARADARRILVPQSWLLEPERSNFITATVLGPASLILGDAILCIYGAPVLNESHPTVAVRAAVEASGTLRVHLRQRRNPGYMPHIMSTPQH